MTLEVMRAAAVEFLRYERGCKVVALERTPLIGDPCNPDVVGVNGTRRLVEVEIKRTWSDYRNNKEKWSMVRRKSRGLAPSQFYFLVPPELADRVQVDLGAGEGLLTLDGVSSYTGLPKAVVRVAARPSGAKPLRLKEVVRMVAHQTGTLSSALTKIARSSLN